MCNNIAVDLMIYDGGCGGGAISAATVVATDSTFAFCQSFPD